MAFRQLFEERRSSSPVCCGRGIPLRVYIGVSDLREQATKERAVREKWSGPNFRTMLFARRRAAAEFVHEVEQESEMQVFGHRARGYGQNGALAIL